MMLEDAFLRLDEDGRPEADERGSTPEYLLRCLLDAREEAGWPSNEEGFDEDVNVYVAGLLQRFLTSAFHEEAARWLRPSDIDLAREARRCRDARVLFHLYRTNADYLLLGIGIFRHVPGASHPATPLAHREPEEYIGRGGTYYRIASSHLRHLLRRSTGPELAMRKLGEHFARYVEVLRRVRLSHFHLTERLGEGALFHLLQPGEGGKDGALDRSELYDAFLDALSAWKRAPGPQTHAELGRAVEQLRAADPAFRFELPPADFTDGGVSSS